VNFEWDIIGLESQLMTHPLLLLELLLILSLLSDEISEILAISLTLAPNLDLLLSLLATVSFLTKASKN